MAFNVQSSAPRYPILPPRGYLSLQRQGLTTSACTCTMCISSSTCDLMQLCDIAIQPAPMNAFKHQPDAHKKGCYAVKLQLSKCRFHHCGVAATAAHPPPTQGACLRCSCKSSQSATLLALLLAGAGRETVSVTLRADSRAWHHPCGKLRYAIRLYVCACISAAELWI